MKHLEDSIYHQTTVVILQTTHTKLVVLYVGYLEMTEPVGTYMQHKQICGWSLCEFVVNFDKTITKLIIISTKSPYYFACKVVTPSKNVCKVLRND